MLTRLLSAEEGTLRDNAALCQEALVEQVSCMQFGRGHGSRERESVWLGAEG
jgi:hypothetical protein